MATNNLAPRNRISGLFHLWETGVIGKYEFYGETLRHRPSTIAQVTGIDKAVIEDRRRYLRQLAECPFHEGDSRDPGQCRCDEPTI